MITLADMTLRVARLVMDIIDGTATTGSATTIEDTVNLIQINQYFDRGTLWILSGSCAGKVTTVEGFAANIVTVANLGNDVVAGDRYAVARAIYPYNRIVAAINDALLETFVIKEAVSDPPEPIIGDGVTDSFALPDGASQVVAVEMEDPVFNQRFPSNHWTEQDGMLTFLDGFTPINNWIVHPYTKQDHPTLSNATDEIDAEISIEWLRWKAAEYALYWGVSAYGQAAEYRIEERLNRVLNKLKGLTARKPLYIVHTAGG